MPRTNQGEVVVVVVMVGCLIRDGVVGGGGGWGGVKKGVQFAPHGGTEVLLVSGHCLADCPRRLPVFFCFTVHCLPPVSRSAVGAGPPLPPHHHPPPPPPPPLSSPLPGANGHSHSPEDCSSLPPTPTWCLCYFLQPTTSFWLGRHRLSCAGRRRLTQTLRKPNASRVGFSPIFFFLWSFLIRWIMEGRGSRGLCKMKQVGSRPLVNYWRLSHKTIPLMFTYHPFPFTAVTCVVGVRRQLFKRWWISSLALNPCIYYVLELLLIYYMFPAITPCRHKH